MRVLAEGNNYGLLSTHAACNILSAQADAVPARARPAALQGRTCSLALGTHLHMAPGAAVGARPPGARACSDVR